MTLLTRLCCSHLFTSASAKSLVQKRTKEKFPVDIVTASKPVLDKEEQLPEVKMELPSTETIDTEALPPSSAEAENSTQGLDRNYCLQQDYSWNFIKMGSLD